MTNITAGQNALLSVTKEANHRILVGLSWNPPEPGLLDKVQEIAGLRSPHCNLDLSCYMLSQAGQVLEIVNQNPEYAVSKGGEVYHSGDNVDGIGDGDNEEISAELKNLPKAIHSLVFVARIESGNHFGEVSKPAIRLADGYTDRNFLYMDLTGDDEDANYNTFIFCQISRDQENWMLKNISTYLHTQSMSDIEGVIALEHHTP